MYASTTIFADLKGAIKRLVACQRHDNSIDTHLDYEHLPDVENGPDEDKDKYVKDDSCSYIVHPNGRLYQMFWYLTVAGAAWTGVIKPYTVAFATKPGLHPLTDTPAIQEYLLSTVYLLDMLFKFRLAFVEREQLVTDPIRIRARYLRKLFWIDLAALVPLDLLVLLILGHRRHKHTDFNSTFALASFQFARCLRLLRMYRVPELFLHLEYQRNLSLLAVTLVRNFVFTYYSVHWSACIFYYIARMQGLGGDTWIGHDTTLLIKSTPFERYIVSVYWSITTLATVGYGDFTARNIPETAWALVYMFYNLGLSAYILGSFTLIALRSDEQVNAFRTKCSNLKDYANSNSIPKDLWHSMESHLRLRYEHEEISDEAVLATVPGTIRRRILRYLYSEQLHMTYLFKGCHQKLLDALLSVSRVELYRPLEDVLVKGDWVNELYLVVSGACDVITSNDDTCFEDVSFHSQGGTSRTLKVEGETLRQGRLFGEVAFFTEVPQLVGVRASEITRILTIARPAYDGAITGFPLGARSILENLRDRAEEMVKESFSSDQQQRLTRQLKRVGSEHLSLSSRHHSSGCLKRLSTGSNDGERIGNDRGNNRGAKLVNSGTRRDGTETGDSSNAKATVRRGNRGMPLKGDDSRESCSLPDDHGSSSGSAACIGGDSSSSDQGASSDDEGSSDYEDLASLSFSFGSPELGTEATSAIDRDYSVRSGVSFAGTHCSTGDAERSQALRRAVGTSRGLSLRQEQVLAGAMRVRTLVASAIAKSTEHRNNMFLTACSSADTDMVLQMLQQGHDAQACDYDGRTGLMLAAAGGHRAVLRILLAARAHVNAVDNGGRTALDEACGKGHDDVAQQLKKRGARLGASGVCLASQLCEAVFEGDMPMLRRLIAAGAAVNSCDYDKRTALHIAASEGSLCAVRLLVEEGHAKPSVRDRWGATPLAEAHRVGAQPVIDYLLPRSPEQAQQGPDRKASAEAFAKHLAMLSQPSNSHGVEGVHGAESPSRGSN